MTDNTLVERVDGVIREVRFGLGGYQDAMLGLTVLFDFSDSICQDFVFLNWVDRPMITSHGVEALKLIAECLKDAKVLSIHELAGKPVEVTFKNYKLSSWRIVINETPVAGI